MHLASRMCNVLDSNSQPIIDYVSKTPEGVAQRHCVAAYSTKTSLDPKVFYVEPNSMYGNAATDTPGAKRDSVIVYIYPNGAWLCSCRASHTHGSVCPHFMLLRSQGVVEFHPVAHLDAAYWSKESRLILDRAEDFGTLSVQPPTTSTNTIRPLSDVRFSSVSDSWSVFTGTMERESSKLVVRGQVRATTSADTSDPNSRDALLDEVKKVMQRNLSHAKSDPGTAKLHRFLDSLRDVERYWTNEMMVATGLRAHVGAKTKKRKRDIQPSNGTLPTCRKRTKTRDTFAQHFAQPTLTSFLHGATCAAAAAPRGVEPCCTDSRPTCFKEPVL